MRVQRHWMCTATCACTICSTLLTSSNLLLAQQMPCNDDLSIRKRKSLLNMTLFMSTPQGPHQQRHHFQTRMWTRNWRHSILHHLCKLPSMDPGITDPRFCKQQLPSLRPLLASCTTEATMAKLRRSDARLD